MGPVGLHVLIDVNMGANSTLLNCLKQNEVNSCRYHNTRGDIILHVVDMIINITIIQPIENIENMLIICKCIFVL